LTESIGILGGTFNPPHIGHLILADTACDTLALSQVLFVPAAIPPHKLDQSILPIEHRLAMLRAALAGNSNFVISDVDIARPGPHYTVDMLKIVQRQYPAAQLYFLIGGDSLHNFLNWRDPLGIVAQAKLVVMTRPGITIDMAALEAAIPTFSQRISFVDAPAIGIAATLIRERLQAGRSIRYLVPDEVYRYIEEHKLYRNRTYA